MNNEVYAAIAMALSSAESGAMMHDEEPGKITIKPRKTLWSTLQTLILR